MYRKTTAMTVVALLLVMVVSPATPHSLNRSVPQSPLHIGPEPLEPADIRPLEPMALAARDRSGHDTTWGKTEISGHVGYVTTTCTVATPADGGPGTLRQCLLDSAQGATIDFDPQAFPPTTPVTIALSSPLPLIAVHELTIDGSNAGVILDGSKLDEGDGLVIDGAQGVTIRGLQVLDFPRHGISLLNGAKDATIGGDPSQGSGPLGQGNLISRNGDRGVSIADNGTTNNDVVGNYIGTDVSGMAARGNVSGVVITDGAGDNTIGGVTSADRNVIAGNTGREIQLQGEGTVRNQVAGNYIGTNSSGTIVLGPTDSDGIVISFAASNNVVGGNTPGSGNVINTGGNGITIQQLGTDGNRVLGNYIGVDPTGTQAVGNALDGVALLEGPRETVIGGETPSTRNIISGNRNGVWVQGAETMDTKIVGNYIGTDVTGVNALGNSYDGILVGWGAHDNLVGGNEPGHGNLISANGEVGVLLFSEGTSGNRLLGNYIGTDVTGQLAMPNTVGGVMISSSATENVIGGQEAGARNLISGNSRIGIEIQLEGTDGNQVLGNYIGTDISGTAALGNQLAGVGILFGPKDNAIGGDAPGARNVISGNMGYGVAIQNEGTSGNQVIGNYVGTDITGAATLGNTWSGVVLMVGAQDNVVGGDVHGAGNLISGNGEAGVELWDTGTKSNKVLGNYIGTDLTGSASLANMYGVYIGLGANNNVIGRDTPDGGNLISGNGEAGVWLQDAGTTNNQIAGNHIGTNALGMLPLPNATHGVYLGGGAGWNTIGTNNTIAYNGSAGVTVDGETTLGNTITRNIIHHNGGLPIDFINMPLPTGPLSPPALTGYSLSDNVLSGSACAGCRVEIFANPSAQPAATSYLDAVIADANGDFSLTLAGLPPFSYDYCTATATGPDGTTSEFSSGFRVVFRVLLFPILKGYPPATTGP